MRAACLVLALAIGYALAMERQSMRKHVAKELKKLRKDLERDDSDKVLDWPGKRSDVA